jgi:hypothetical protein
MKKVFYAPYLMLALALMGIAIAFYDAYAIYNAQALWCPPPVNGCNEVASRLLGRLFDTGEWRLILVQGLDRPLSRRPIGV